VKGEQDLAEEMIKENVSLLFKSGKATDYSGRTLEGTALQMALGAQDVAVGNGYFSGKCMTEMIIAYLKKYAEPEIKRQYDLQFPPGWEKEEKKRSQIDSERLGDVIQTICKSEEEKECQEALQTFRDFLTPKNVIRTGYHFNQKLLLEAFQLYQKNFHRFDDLDSWKNKLIWSQVIGYIQRFLPACDAQALCQGLYPLMIEESECSEAELNRSLKLGWYSTGSTSFFPLPSSPSGLGYEWAVALDSEKYTYWAEPLAYISNKNYIFEGWPKYVALKGARVYEHGQNYKEAKKVYEQLNTCNTKYRLGLFYEKGLGVKTNNEQAVEYYKDIARLEYIPGIIKLASCCEDGDKVEKLYKEMEWRRNYEVKLGYGLYHLNKETEEGYGKMRECFLRGNIFSPISCFWQYYVSFCHELGLGVERDYSCAAKHCREAAEFGIRSAQKRMAWFYLNGIGVEKNDKAAEYWYSMWEKNVDGYNLSELQLIKNSKILKNITQQEEVFDLYLRSKGDKDWLEKFNKDIQNNAIKRLRDWLEGRGYKMVSMNDDGNDQFCALANQLAVPISHNQLRELAVETIEEQKESFQPHLQGNETMDQYLNRVKKDGERGGYLTLLALSRALNATIKVVFVWYETIDIPPEPKSQQPALFLACDNILGRYFSVVSKCSSSPSEVEEKWGKKRR
jgi:TPR repeat protein